MGTVGDVTATYSQTSTPTPTPGQATGRAAPWLAGGGIALLACALVSGLAQAAHDFRWWSLFVVIPTSLIAAAGAVALRRGGGILAYAVANLGLIAFAVGVMLMFGDVPRFWPVLIVLAGRRDRGQLLVASAGPAGPVVPPHARNAGHRRGRPRAGVPGAALRPVRLQPRWWAWYIGGGRLGRRRQRSRAGPASHGLPRLRGGPRRRTRDITILLGIRFLRGWWF